MDRPLFRAALFDFDGTLMDTESQYSSFWRKQGEMYRPEILHFESIIKGQTLDQIFASHFAGMIEIQQRITNDLNEFEKTMQFDYISGGEEFVRHLRLKGVKTAIVTSSNNMKMANVYRVRPELRELFDLVLTADMFILSKPNPECFLVAASYLNCTPSECVVFEDSLHGLQAGRAAGMSVIALSTTNTKEVVEPLADAVWPDFKDCEKWFAY